VPPFASNGISHSPYAEMNKERSKLINKYHVKIIIIKQSLLPLLSLP
jgi:hypothetical protein